MTEPTYGSGQYDPGQGYGGQGYGQPPQVPYGGPQYGGPVGQPGPVGHPPAGYHGGYPSGSTPLPTPPRPRTSAGVGDGALRFAAALEALISGIGLGGLNIAVGAWLTARKAP
jgi:hypothetical protein